MEKFCIQNSNLFSFFLLLLLFTFNCYASTQNDDVDEVSLSRHEPVRIRVGLVLDMGSLEGNIVGSSVSMALSDFYAINDDYKTRISVSMKNSHGEPLIALSSAVDLLQNEGVEAIIVGNTLLEARLLAEIGEKAKVPVISLDSPISLSLSKYSHLIQATHDSVSEAKGITAFINMFKWNSVALVYEDDDDWRESMQVLVDHFYENSVRVRSKVGFEVSSSEDFMMDRLQKLKKFGTTVFVVHLSESIATHLFQCAERLGLMGEGFAWILTAKTMNNFHVKADDFAKEAMEGVVGFRTYIPMSKELQKFTLRWRKSLADAEVPVGSEITRLSISAVWAHDIAWALASAAEVAKVTNVTSTLLEAITKSRFKGLSGEFQLNDRKLLSDKFEIVNLIGSGERRVGFWNSNGSFTNRRHLSSTHNKLETIIWPGGSSQIPKASNLDEMSKKKLRVLVTSNNRFPKLMEVDTDSQTHVTSAKGFCIEVFEAAIEPFKYDVVYISWLNKNDSNYDDLAYELYSQKDKYDAAVGDITITSNRSTFVDFTLPFTEMGLGILAPKERSMWVFFQPLTVNLWITTGAFFVLTGIVVWLIERPENKKFQGPWPQQIGVMLYFGFSTLVYAHREKLQYNLSRFVVTVWVFAVLILTTSYTATLTSMMTMQQIRFNANKDYVGVGQLPGSLIAKVARNISTYNIQIKGLNNSGDYAQALMSKTVSSIVDEMPYLKVLLGENPSDFLMVKSKCTTDGFGFMFQKGHELVANMSRRILELRSSERLNEMEKRWFDKQLAETSDQTSDPLSLYRFRGLFMITGVSLSIALAIRLIQYLREQSEVLVSSVKVFLSQRLQLLRILFSRTIYPSPLDDPIGENMVQMAELVR